LALNVLTDYGLLWLILLAGAGLVLMLGLVLLVLSVRVPTVGKIVRGFLLSPPSLNARLVMGFMVVSIIPALVLPPLLAVTAVSTMQNDRIAQLAASATAIGSVLNPLIDKQASGVTMLAANITATGQLEDSALSEWLLRYHKQHPEFVSVWVAKPDGRVVTATGSANGEVTPWEGPQSGVALMDTFTPSVEKKGLYMSTVQKGVAPRFDPMMIISAPIFDAWETVWGVVQGQLNLRELYADFIDQQTTSASALHTLITDSQNQVLLTSREMGFSQFEDLSTQPLLTRMADSGNATSYGFKGALQEFGEPENFAVAQRPLDNGWRVFVIASQADIEKQALGYFGLLLVWAAIALLLAKTMSRIHSSNLSESLQQLQESLHIFDAERTISVIPLAPKTSPREVQQVYNRVRESMRKSRDAYRDLRRVVTEGEEMRRELKDVGGEKKRRSSGSGKSDAAPPSAKADAAPPTYQGRIDSVTQLAGLEVFEEFFGEAWIMGAADNRPLSLVLLGLCSNKISAPDKVAEIDIVAIKEVAAAVRAKITRTLDLVTRIDADKFGVVLPDTNLEGALAAANRIQQAAQAVVGEAYLINSGVVTIVPNPDGNARSFINLAHRALRAAEQQGGKVTFFNAKGKIMVLDEQSFPESPEDALTIKSETVTAKSIDDDLAAGPAKKSGKQPRGSGTATVKSETVPNDAKQEKKTEDKELAPTDTADFVIEWDSDV